MMEFKKIVLLSPHLGELYFRDKCLRNFNRAFLKEIDYLALAKSEHVLKFSSDKLEIIVTYGIGDDLKPFLTNYFHIYLESQKDYPVCLRVRLDRYVDTDTNELFELIDREEEDHQLSCKPKYLAFGRILEFKVRIEDYLNNKIDFSEIG